MKYIIFHRFGTWARVQIYQCKIIFHKKNPIIISGREKKNEVSYFQWRLHVYLNSSAILYDTFAFKKIVLLEILHFAFLIVL